MGFQKDESLAAQEIDDKLSTTAAAIPFSTSSNAKIKPMVVEERARTIPKINEDETPLVPNNARQNKYERGENVNVIDRGISNDDY